MGGDGDDRHRGRSSRSIKKRRRRHSNSDDGGSSTDSESESESSESGRPDRSSRRRHKSSHRRRNRRESDSPETLSLSKRKNKEKRTEREDRKKERRREKHRQRTHRSGKKRVESESERSSSEERSGSNEEHEQSEAAVRRILQKFPEAAGDLRQLLEMVDGGQAVDVGGISSRPLVKLLKSLFLSLKLKQSEDSVFLLPPGRLRTLDVVGSLLPSNFRFTNEDQPASPDEDSTPKIDIGPSEESLTNPDSLPQRRRFIGPEMPSAELLAAAAKLTEAETKLRNADMEAGDDLFIGPPPPAVVAEAESANEAERFEEVTRIIGVKEDGPYEVLGVNWKMSTDNIKKKYWKLSLLVHPDKCSHPEAHQAFVKLNKAFKLLQDPDQRKATDEKIKQKEEQEAFKAELQSLREAAKWRRSQGISMEGDDLLLVEETQPPQREEWMTTLPPERKHGIPMQSTSFTKTGREGRGDTSVWTDSPVEKAQKAKQSYLEAYDKATAIAFADEEKKKARSDADLVDKYNRAKRSKTLMQKHQEESSRPKKKSKQPEKEDWVGQHPWKPWDREKDLVAGRQKVNIDTRNMSEGLASRFSSGSFQRDFL